jgi:hypothetical protein
MTTQATQLEAASGRLAEPRDVSAKSRSRRATFLKWLRKIHGWIGLWGAVLGLLFGVTGVLQNHRATMKIRVGGPIVSTVHVALPDPAPKSPRELATYLQTELRLDRAAERTTREAAKPVTWGDKSVIQPEHWEIRFIAPDYLVNADFWKGENSVSVERRDQGLMNTLEGLHRANGARVGWILLADSFAGSMILLSLTGVLLWTGLNRRRTLGASILIVSLMAALVLAAQSI